jgi:hypothetical protein
VSLRASVRTNPDVAMTRSRAAVMCTVILTRDSALGSSAVQPPMSESVPWN